VAHSNTVQPIASGHGQLLDKFLLILQEKANEFGASMRKDLIGPPNIIAEASKSRKSSNEKCRTFLIKVLCQY
jgi:hypothetical protein